MSASRPSKASCAICWARFPAHASRSASARVPRNTFSCWPVKTAKRWPRMRRWWNANCAPSPASATSPAVPAWCGPSSSCAPTRPRAADLGVTSAAIADTLRIATAGDYDQSLPKLNLSQRQIPIVVRPAGRSAHRPGAAGQAARARHPWPGDTGQRGHAVDRQRAGADRPLQPPAQRQLRDRTEPAAAGPGEGRGAGPAQLAAAATGRDPDRDRRRRGHGRALRQLRSGDADGRAVHPTSCWCCCSRTSCSR